MHSQSLMLFVFYVYAAVIPYNATTPVSSQRRSFQWCNCISPLEMKHVCFMLGLYAYRAVNTPSRLYKTNLLTLYEENVDFFSEIRTQHL